MDQAISKTKILADLINMDSPQAVLDEVLFIQILINPLTDLTQLTNAFNLTVSLYQGVWPSEQACNTGFHDLHHITHTFLAMARLVHGAIIHGYRLDKRQIFTGLVAALSHDSGYIQDKKDGVGTGAKYTAVHVERSVAFVERYGQRYGLMAHEIPACQLMIQCTDLNVDVARLDFPSTSIEILAKLLAVADLIGQMGDRIYLEKLFYLYCEFKEGRVSKYSDEKDLLRKTLSFFNFTRQRIASQLDDLDYLVKEHFKVRWNINKNLYRVAIEKHRQYLEYILDHPERDPRDLLRRKQIVKKIIGRIKSDPSFK